MFGMAFLSTLLLIFSGPGGVDADPAVVDVSTGGGVEVGTGSDAPCRNPSASPSDKEDKPSAAWCPAEQTPKVWIGVRVSTVPDALAAHLKRGALMIVNVAENSPADQAGVDRYDVVLSFSQHKIDGMQDLLDAIRENGPDRAASMVIIQGGEEKTVTLTPVRRDLDVAPTYKYEEQEVAEVDPLQKYFGHRLKLGPGGELQFTPQGRLDRLPDEIRSLLDEVPELDWDFRHDLLEGIGVELDDYISGLESDIDADESDESSHITITVTEDGKSLTIVRDEDGTFTVERQEADGQRSSESYDDADEFRMGDPEAYRVYRRSLSPRGVSAIVVPPDLKDLGSQQRQFQHELRSQLDKALRHYAGEGRPKIEIRVDEGRVADDEDTATSTSSSKTVNLVVENGRVTLTITEDGAKRKYEFDSWTDFEESEPELYEKYGPSPDE